MLNPATSTEALTYVLDKLDIILIMSVNPGFGGQAFIPATLAKLRQVRQLIGDRSIRLAIDGGVNADNIATIAAAGADMFIAGSAIFGASDYRQAIARLRKQLAIETIKNP